MEESGTLSLQTLRQQPPPEQGATSSFEQCLLHRARAAVLSHRLEADLEHAARLSKRFSLALMLIAAATGAVAVLNAITANVQTLNIYWLLLVLLGFNFISIALWLVSLAWRPGGSAAGAASGLMKALWRQIELRITHKKNLRRAAADRGWLTVCHHGSAGYWWLAGLSHGLWLAYLGAGLLMLLLLLMLRQFDFIWATTILSDETFISLTQTLATPLRALGVPVPGLEQIRLSRLGALAAEATSSQGETRRLWAAFLLGAVTLYGALPRLLLLSLAKTMETLARHRYRLDLEQPYYLRLLHTLMPGSGTPWVVDPDPGRAPAKPQPRGQKTQPPPAGAYWVGVELTSGDHWPPNGIAAGDNLGQITGSDSLRQAILRLSSDPGRERVAAVNVGRLPDRGVKRTLSQLYASAAPEKRWLAVLCPAADSDETFAQRLQDWRSVAADCDIPSRHLTVIQDDSLPPL